MKNFKKTIITIGLSAAIVVTAAFPQPVAAVTTTTYQSYKNTITELLSLRKEIVSLMIDLATAYSAKTGTTTVNGVDYSTTTLTTLLNRIKATSASDAIGNASTSSKVSSNGYLDDDDGDSDSDNGSDSSNNTGNNNGDNGSSDSNNNNDGSESDDSSNPNSSNYSPALDQSYSPLQDYQATHYPPLSAEEQAKIKEKCSTAKNNSGSASGSSGSGDFICVVDSTDASTGKGMPVRSVVVMRSNGSSDAYRAVTGLPGKQNASQSERLNVAETGNPLPDGIYRTGEIYDWKYSTIPKEVIRVNPTFNTARTGILFHKVTSSGATHGCIGLLESSDMYKLLEFVKSKGGSRAALPVYVNIK